MPLRHIDRPISLERAAWKYVRVVFPPSDQPGDQTQMSGRTQDSPLVSIVIPVYNAERWLAESMADILGQTIRSTEIIFVDDGSTDGSIRLLEEAVRRDSRVRVVRQNHKFAGCARNVGLDAARGKWFIALDADDRFEPTLLEETVRRGDETGAEVVLFDSDRLLVPFTKSIPDKGLVISKSLPEGVFEVDEKTSEVFAVLAPWNKLYRLEFLRKGGFRYSETFESNDILFSFLTLASAKRVAALGRTLVHYRVGNPQSVQGMKDRSPTDGARVFLDLKAELIRRGLERRFSGIYASSAVKVLLGRRFATFAKRESATALWRFLKSEDCAAIGLQTMEVDALVGPDADMLRGWLKDFQTLSLEDWLWSLVIRYRESSDNHKWERGRLAADRTRFQKNTMEQAKVEVQKERRRAARAEKALATLRSSFSCRLGFTLTWPIRRLFSVARGIKR